MLISFYFNICLILCLVLHSIGFLNAADCLMEETQYNSEYYTMALEKLEQDENILLESKNACRTGIEILKSQRRYLEEMLKVCEILQKENLEPKKRENLFDLYFMCKKSYALMCLELLTLKILSDSGEIVPLISILRDHCIFHCNDLSTPDSSSQAYQEIKRNKLRSIAHQLAFTIQLDKFKEKSLFLFFSKKQYKDALESFPDNM